MRQQKFYDIAEKNNKRRKVLDFVIVILFMYAIILVCTLLNCEWWVNNEMACFIASFIYIVSLASIDHATPGVTIFQDRLHRLQDEADYCEAPYFVNRTLHYYAPINNGDYIVLSNSNYLKFDSYPAFHGKGFYFDRMYSMEATLMDGNKKIYSVIRDTYDYGDILNELYKTIKADGLDIEAIYNHFGDLKWKKSDKSKDKSKVDLYYLKIYNIIWPILQFIVVILPIVYILSTNRKIWNYE